MAMGRNSLWVGRGPEGPSGPRREHLGPLGNLSYMAGYGPAPPRSGVLTYERARAMPGVNLCLSAHKAHAALLAMDGSVLHEWEYAHDRLPEALREQEPKGVRTPPFFRNALVLPNGDLLAIYENRGIIKLDRDSRLLWYRPNGAHHDLAVLPGGGMVTLSCRETADPVREAAPKVTDDVLCFLDPEGNEKERISIAECFLASPFSALLRDREEEGGELFHANKLQVLDGAWAGKDPAFAEGNILLSLRQPSALAVVDVKKRSIAWVRTGGWRHQHESRLLPDGHLILLDNQGYFGNARVLEIDPFTGEEIWEYHGNPPESFRTFLAGNIERLANGGTLVTDSISGRAFELSPGDGRVVWEYVNPHQVLKGGLGEEGGAGQTPGGAERFIAALFKMERLPPDFPLGWAAAAQAAGKEQGQ